MDLNVKQSVWEIDVEENHLKENTIGKKKLDLIALITLKCCLIENEIQPREKGKFQINIDLM